MAAGGLALGTPCASAASFLESNLDRSDARVEEASTRGIGETYTVWARCLEAKGKPKLAVMAITLPHTPDTGAFLLTSHSNSWF